MNSKIVIISQPVQSGKTTALMNQINVNKDCDGILSPDISGERKLLLIRKNTLIDFETKNEIATTKIGRFRFLNKSFDVANNYLINIKPKVYSEIIIDEIGKLELDKKGFFTSLNYHLQLIRKSDSHHRLILVVRDTLLEEVILTFKIENPQIITIKELKNASNTPIVLPIIGLVLCGGKSERMGMDKAFLKYHQTEQYKYIAQLFLRLNIPTIISCNETQLKNISKEYSALTDEDEFKNNGPISGLLTAFKHYQNNSFIIVGCDYPFLKLKHIETLVSLSKFGFDAVCFVRPSNNPINEPLITFYHITFKDTLFTSFAAGNTSIKSVLDRSNILKVMVEDDLFLNSCDTPEAFNNFHHLNSIS